MAKNILLLFLSDVKTAKRGDKVIVSVTTYDNIDGKPALTTNESAVRYLLHKSSLDKIDNLDWQHKGTVQLIHKLQNMTSEITTIENAQKMITVIILLIRSFHDFFFAILFFYKLNHL